MRDAFEAARDAGVNLAFLGANTGYWQIRYEDGWRTIVEYRHPDLDPEPDPALKTTTFRELIPPRPECKLLGVAYGQIGDSQRLSRSTPLLYRYLVRGTGFTPDSTLHGSSATSGTGCSRAATCPSPTVFFHSEHQNGAPPVEGARWNADAVRYTAASGARVFNGGSLQFAWGLDPLQERYDARLDRFMRNGLDDLTRPAAPTRSPRPPARQRRCGRGVPLRTASRSRGSSPSGTGVRARSRLVDPGVVRIPLRGCTAFLDRPGRGVFRYAVAYLSRWRTSVPTLGPAVRSQAPPILEAKQRNPCVRRLPPR